MNPLHNQPTEELNEQSLGDCIKLTQQYLTSHLEWHITDELIEDGKLYSAYAFANSNWSLCIYDADDKRVTEFKDIQGSLHHLIESPNTRSTYTIINPDGTLETGISEGFKAIYGSCPSSAPPVQAMIPGVTISLLPMGLCSYSGPGWRSTEFTDMKGCLHQLNEYEDGRVYYTAFDYSSVIIPISALPPQVSPGSPSLADQNWARRFIQDHETEKASRPNWKPPKAVQDSLAEAQDIVHRADTQTEKDKAAEDLHQRLGYLGY